MNVVLALRQAHTRLVLELVLSDEPGVTVVGTASETEGLLALTRTAHPDLVVLEWGLPGRSAEALFGSGARTRRPDLVSYRGRDSKIFATGQ